LVKAVNIICKYCSIKHVNKNNFVLCDMLNEWMHDENLRLHCFVIDLLLSCGLSCNCVAGDDYKKYVLRTSVKLVQDLIELKFSKGNINWGLVHVLQKMQRDIILNNVNKFPRWCSVVRKGLREDSKSLVGKSVIYVVLNIV